MSKKNRKSQAQTQVHTATEQGDLDIVGVSRATGLSQIYVRHAIRHKKLTSYMIPLGPESKLMKHMITPEALEAWRANTSARSRREDGRGKYVLYATPEEHALIVTLLENNSIGAIVQKAWSKKEEEDDGNEVESPDLQTEIVAEPS